MSAFPALLRQHREAADLSKSHLALLISCDQTYIGLLERGTKAPSRATVLSLAEAFKLSVSGTDRLLYVAGFSTLTDYQALYEATHGTIDAWKKREKWCWACQSMLPFTRFSRDRHRYDGLQERCKACDADRRKRLRARVALRGQRRSA